MTRPAVWLSVFVSCGVMIAADCQGLKNLELPSTTINVAEVVPAGDFVPPAGRTISQLPEFCRVAGVIQPSDDSNIQFEVWMPVSGWNGKFQGIGNGGFAGAIGYDQLAGAVRNNYATASTDTGHRGGGIDASWALNHPEKITDYGYRAIHEMTAKGKAIVSAYYGEGPRRSYFNSCSNGGRQALMEAQRYPEDYDGIIAGAPANYWTHLLSNAAANVLALSGDSYIPASKLPAIQAAGLGSCDAGDGVKDGVIGDPPRCRFDPGVLQCAGPETDGCLTAAQIKALKQLYTGVRAKGKQVFPGYPAGGEAEAGGWLPWITGPAPEKSALYGFSTQFFKNMVYSDPAWDYRTFSLERDMKVADDKLARVLNATDPDLSRFYQRGGKLILYHGWSDAAIAAPNTIAYYQSVVEKMGKDKAGRFVRLFMAPGVQHCGGGSGANNFGQLGVAMGTPDRNISAALEHWVEQGAAPEQIIAVKYKSDTDPRSEVVLTRPLCAYPLVARYSGSGSTGDAKNFTCEVQSK